MPYFDPREQRLHARVVYDGPAGAGKTANLLGLARLFAGAHDTEVHSPEEIAGYTLVLDWMEIHAGLVAGVPLVCQIVAVPGHDAFRERRRALVSTADVVVHVCEATARGIERSRRALRDMRSVAPSVSLVVQANHRDANDALRGADVAAALGVAPDAIVESIASDGTGVVDTFVAAVRVLSRELSERGDAGARRVRVGAPPSRRATVARIAAIAAAPDACAELYLLAASEEVATTRRHEAVARAAKEPRLPDDDVATGFVWPADTGRAALRALSERGLAGGTPRSTAAGGFVYNVHQFVFETRRSRRYESTEAAKVALVADARACTQLENLLVEGTVLAAKESADGAVWIWTAQPEIPPLAAALAPTAAASRANLEAYGTALAHAARVASAHELAMDLRLSAFGLQGGVVRYTGSVRHGLGHGLDLAAALEGLGEDDAAIVLAAFERENRRTRARDEHREAVVRDTSALGAEAGTR